MTERPERADRQGAPASPDRDHASGRDPGEAPRPGSRSTPGSGDEDARGADVGHGSSDDVAGRASRPTHFDEEGRPRMVDVTGKGSTRRRAVAEGRIRMAPDTLRALVEGRSPKGDVLQVARLAGIMAGKRTGELIPLCHVLPATSLSVDLEPDPDLPGVRVRAEATVAGRTGVEMEALTAASLALLTVYDMLKALDRDMVVEEVRLVRKEGGRSGTWTRETGRPSR